MTPNPDQLLPNAPEAEMALLGSLILDGRMVGPVLDVLHGPGDFFQTRHQAVYKAIVDIWQDDPATVDAVSLKQQLDDRGQYDQIGGVAYLAQVMESVPHATSAEYYAKLVRDKADARALLVIADNITRRASDGVDVSDQLDVAQSDIFALTASMAQQTGADGIGAILAGAYEELMKRDGQVSTGLQTGFMDLDKILCGLQDGEMLILAARPSIGKTALAMNIAAYLAIQQKVPVLVFSLEMDRRQLGTRLMSAHGNVDAYHIRSNTISADEFKRLQVACGSIGDSPLFVDDQPGLTVLQMRARVRKAVIDHGVKLVVLDYLQLMQGPGADLRHRVVDLSLGIKQLARETHLPILCLSQMSRATEGREDHRPMMSDMRESGSLEADADVVLLLHRKGFYDAQKADHEQVNDYNTAELIVAKQRNGPTGVVKLFFDGATTSFKSYADPDKF